METSALLTGQAQGPPTDAHPPFPPGVEGLHLEGPPLEDCPSSVTGEGREEGAAAWAGPLHVGAAGLGFLLLLPRPRGL